MCVILQKNPGFEVPFEHLLAAAHRNQHGFGVVVNANGKLERFSGIPTNPEIAAKEVERILNDAKDELAFVHFRHRTRGSIDELNTQPISLLSRDDGDDADVYFLHNGTIDKEVVNANFSDGPSDSLIFANEIVGPLVRRSAAYLGPDRALDDPLISTVLSGFGGWSRFVLVDSFGRSLIVNEDSGEKQTYGWASNSHSLDPKNFKKEEKKATTTKIISQTPWPATGPTYEKLSQQMADNENKPQRVLRTPIYQRQTVHSATGYSLEDFHLLSEEEIDDMVKKHPTLAALLILDLIEFHYSHTAEAE